MKNIMKKTLPLLLLSSCIHAESISIDSIGLNIGQSSTNITQNDYAGSVVLGHEPDDTYTQVELFANVNGIMENSSIKPTVQISYAENDDFTNLSLMVGLNQYFDYDSYTLYVGALVGVGKLKWQYNPLVSTDTEEYSAYSPVGAVQVGAEYKITETILLGANAKYSVYGYETSLKTNSETYTEIRHSNSPSVSISLRYLF